MSDFEKYVEAAADEMTGQQIGAGFYSLNVGPSEAREMARAALAVVGPLIAEDTRERMVAAAARAVERDVVIEEPAVADAAQPPIIVCEPREDCADPHIYRWHCMRGHDGAAPGVCPLEYCDRKGANR